MLIALLTDFGTKDYFVGAMKGVIFSINQNAEIIDITHEIEPQNIQSASFNLRACYKNFPKKTIFVCVVDPGVGSDRRAILIETEKYYFIAPDNGLLSFVFEEENNFRVFEITNEKYFVHPISRTFHGRDIFAPTAAHLSNAVAPHKFGKQISDFITLPFSQLRKNSAGEFEAQILHIDHFGNLITNITEKDLPEDFYLELNGQKIFKLSKYYSESENDEIIMIFGSSGFLEIAAVNNSARNILKAEISDKISVRLKS